jgi:methylated-DNA-[protein]-cysteine S-methyltransferase
MDYRKNNLDFFTVLRALAPDERVNSGYSKWEMRNKRSKFSSKVIRIVSKIQKGETMTYKKVAKHAGNEKASRAVGNILNKYYKDCVVNKMPTIPCHRVVRSDGKIGGYAGGAKEKRKMLEKEKKK